MARAVARKDEEELVEKAREWLVAADPLVLAERSLVTFDPARIVAAEREVSTILGVTAYIRLYLEGGWVVEVRKRFARKDGLHYIPVEEEPQVKIHHACRG
ncbi:MAG: hypothetical protein GSR80_000106 [Desulfurococcales archaeon]|nr:hypothetical protein [Desulfurococcales archaeon]